MATKQSKPRKGKAAPRTYWAVEYRTEYRGRVYWNLHTHPTRADARQHAKRGNYVDFLTEQTARVVQVQVVERGSR